MSNSPRPRLSGMAIAAFVLAILSFVLSFVAGIPALLLAALSSHRIHKRSEELGGLGYARTAITLALIGSCFSGLLYLMPTALAENREYSWRATCAANLRGITVSMSVYGNENNDVFPLVPPPAKANTYNVELGAGSGKKLASETLVEMQESDTLDGNVSAALWVMVITQQVSPRSYICPGDPFTDRLKSAQMTSAKGEYFMNFQADHQLSYSISYPWYMDNQHKRVMVGPWWRNTTDSSLPVMADMAPMQGTGTPARDVTISGAINTLENPAYEQRGFSDEPTTGPTTRTHRPPTTMGNRDAYDASTPRPTTGPAPYQRANMPFAHGGRGTNVAFGDSHVEWTRSPNVGQSMENIWTSGETYKEKKDGRTFNYDIVLPGKAPKAGEIEPSTRQSAPFDTVMVPLRDGNTGKIR